MRKMSRKIERRADWANILVPIIHWTWPWVPQWLLHPHTAHCKAGTYEPKIALVQLAGPTALGSWVQPAISSFGLRPHVEPASKLSGIISAEEFGSFILISNVISASFKASYEHLIFDTPALQAGPRDDPVQRHLLGRAQGLTAGPRFKKVHDWPCDWENHREVEKGWKTRV